MITTYYEDLDTYPFFPQMKSLARVLHTQMKPDLSNYARGRKRIWLGTEWDLKDRVFKPSELPAAGSELLMLCNHLLSKVTSWQAEIGLLTWSGSDAIGITHHRDDSYADYEAWGINLIGECRFEYYTGYKEFKYNKVQDPKVLHTVDLKPGHLYQFNCKNSHAALPSPNRLAVNLWRISDKLRPQWTEYARTNTT